MKKSVREVIADAREGNLLALNEELKDYPNLFLLRDKDSLNTLLHEAAGAGQLEVVKFILKNDISAIDEPNTTGKTPSELALSNGHAQIADVISQARLLSLSARSKTIKEMFADAREGKVSELNEASQMRLNSFMYKDQNSGNTLLHEAAGAGQLQVVRFILSHGGAIATVNEPNVIGKTPSELALFNGHTQIADVISQARLLVSSSKYKM